MATVLIGGGSGLIGSRLSKLLTDKGYKVIHLSRKRNLKAKYPRYAWDLKAGKIDMEAIEQADYILNFAGAGIADRRWTVKRKAEIISSRTESNLLIQNAVRQSKKPLKAIICASAIGYYGDRGQDWVMEEDQPGNTGFLSESTQAWENAIRSMDDLSIRKVVIRIGVVLSTKGGALKPFLLQNNFRLGTYFGNGQQYYSWVHIDDLCRMFIHCIENEDIQGTFNGVSPDPVKLYDFVKEIAKGMGKKVLMIPAPTFAIRLILGEMADVVLTSARVSSKKIKSQGFSFKYSDLAKAVTHLLEEKI